MTTLPASGPTPGAQPLRIGLVGYGRMGHTLQHLATGSAQAAGGPQTASAQPLEITAIVDPHAQGASHRSLGEIGADQVPNVWIDFSHPDAAWANLESYAAGTTPAILGTTGWTERQPEAQKLLRAGGAPVVWAGNFSLGVTLFRKLVHQAAELLGPTGTYDVAVHETHHRFKADSPSGTALHLAEALQAGHWGERQIVIDRLDRPRADAEIHVSSTRLGNVPGTHTVTFDSPEDTVELTHRARTRDGFAAGALRAAEWLVADSLDPGLWPFSELLDRRLNTHRPQEDS